MNPSSTTDLVSALKVLSQDIQSPDDVPQLILLEAADRITELVKLTSDLTQHIVSNPVHHHRCNARTKGSYCNCVLSRIVPAEIQKQ